MSQLDAFPETIPETAGDRDSWATPPDLFAKLYDEFGLNLDPCAEKWSAKCGNYFTKRENGLAQPWNGRVFLNPPYSDIGPWLNKAVEELRADRAAVVVALLPAAVTDGWWQHWVERYAYEIRFPKGRIQFVPPPGIEPSSNKGMNAIVIFWSHRLRNRPLAKQTGWVRYDDAAEDCY